MLHSMFLFAQNEKNENLIELDSTWGKEVFEFPIRFAQEIDYDGIAEVRFPPEGWRNPEHTFFWSYTYAWDITLQNDITSARLAADLELYFNGLNGVRNDDETDARKASVKLISEKTTGTGIAFSGQVKTYDRFATNKLITLQAKIESYNCIQKNRTILLFKFSPKAYDDIVWETLDAIKLIDSNCNE